MPDYRLRTNINTAWSDGRRKNHARQHRYVSIDDTQQRHLRNMIRHDTTPEHLTELNGRLRLQATNTDAPALHLEEVVLRVPLVPGEDGDRLLRFRDLSGAQEVFGGLFSQPTQRSTSNETEHKSMRSGSNSKEYCRNQSDSGETHHQIQTHSATPVERILSQPRNKPAPAHRCALPMWNKKQI